MSIFEDRRQELFAVMATKYASWPQHADACLSVIAKMELFESQLVLMAQLLATFNPRAPRLDATASGVRGLEFSEVLISSVYEKVGATTRQLITEVCRDNATIACTARRVLLHIQGFRNREERAVALAIFLCELMPYEPLPTDLFDPIPMTPDDVKMGFKAIQESGGEIMNILVRFSHRNGMTLVRMAGAIERIISRHADQHDRQFLLAGILEQMRIQALKEVIQTYSLVIDSKELEKLGFIKSEPLKKPDADPLRTTGQKTKNDKPKN